MRFVRDRMRGHVKTKHWGMIALGVTVLGVAGVTVVMRDELQRYVRMHLMDRKPELAGQSVTPQGNTAALGMSEEDRRRGREHPGVNSGQPIDARMPNLRPA